MGRTPILLFLCSILVMGCKRRRDEPSPVPDDDTDDTDTDDTGEVELARWTFAVFLNGDNDLEDWVLPDINEMEKVGSGNGVHIVVQADRIEGYSTAEGDWTDARRYYITADDDAFAVNSTLVEEIGEVNMGDPEVLSDFAMWAHDTYPAERLALIFWNHGDSWLRSSDPPPDMLSWDETDSSELSIARGDVREGLEAVVAERGPI
ncbi:MAG: hypothetical protein HN348_15955, partial [Proteobacteria bacterium]|nr:hypothetical protein [Pseudomonadota bacterium]